jgi:hypothetical protein
MPDGLSQSLASSPDQPAPVPTSSAASPGIRAASPRWKNPVAKIVKGLAKLLTTGVLVYLTYVFTMFLAHPGQPPAPVPEEAGVGARKIAAVRAEDLRLLSFHGEVDPVTGTVRIPIDRATELIAAENAKPTPLPAPPISSAPVAVPAPEPAPKPGPLGSIPAATTAKAETAAARPAAASKPETLAAGPEAVLPQVEATAPNLAPAQAPAAVATLSPPGSARGGLTQEQLYKAVCQACHDVDGKGGIVRKLMPEIPDFTDSRWQLGRTDTDLIHSVTEGKGQLMLPMKDKLSQARIAPKEMVAFVRAFNPSAVVTAPAAGSPPRPEMP